MRTPTLREIEESDAVFILGEDLTNVAPRMALSVRQSVRQQPMEAVKKLKIPLWLDFGVRDAMQDAKGPLYIATPHGLGSTTSPRPHSMPRLTIWLVWDSQWRMPLTRARRQYPRAKMAAGK